VEVAADNTKLKEIKNAFGHPYFKLSLVVGIFYFFNSFRYLQYLLKIPPHLEH